MVGFVQAGLSWTSARTVVTVMERGSAHHHKVTEVPGNELSVSYLQAVTANLAAPATASGASTPQVHVEIRSTDTEAPAVTGQYWQFHNCVLVSRQWTEQPEGNTLQETYRFLTMNGPTASGYLG